MSYKSEKQAPLLYHNKHMFFALNLQTHKTVTIILRFPKNNNFSESLVFAVIIDISAFFRYNRH